MDKQTQQALKEQQLTKLVSTVILKYFTLNREVYLDMQREKINLEEQIIINSKLFEILECVDELALYFINHDVFSLKDRLSRLEATLSKLLEENTLESYMFKPFAKKLKSVTNDALCLI